MTAPTPADVRAACGIGQPGRSLNRRLWPVCLVCLVPLPARACFPRCPAHGGFGVPGYALLRLAELREGTTCG